MARQRRAKVVRERPLAIGYIRVSTTEQAREGVSLEAQRSELQRQADFRGWDLEIAADEGLSAKDMRRPALQASLERLARGEADLLLAVKLDRISRSLPDFANLMERASNEGWRILCLDPDVDTSTSSGELIISVMAALAQWERRIISERTKAAMAHLRSQGVALGRPVQHTDDTLRLILAKRAEGMSLAALADLLNAEGVLTSQGGKWYPATVKRAAECVRAQRLALTS